MAVVPNRLLVVLQVVLLLRLDILLPRDVLLHQGILLHWGILFLVGRLVEVGWVAVPAVFLVLHLVGQVYLVLVPFARLLCRRLCGIPYVPFVGEFLPPILI